MLSDQVIATGLFNATELAEFVGEVTNTVGAVVSYMIFRIAVLLLPAPSVAVAVIWYNRCVVNTIGWLNVPTLTAGAYVFVPSLTRTVTPLLSLTVPVIVTLWFVLMS